MYIPDVEEFLHVSRYPMLEYIGFGADISDGVAKMRAATILGEIFRLHQRTKTRLSMSAQTQSMGILL